MNSLVLPEFYNPNQEFKGTSGLILFGSGLQKALTYFRCGNTPSYPYSLDFVGGARLLDYEELEPIDYPFEIKLPESPFDTLRREAWEEMRLYITPRDIEHTRMYPSLVDPTMRGFCAAVRLAEARIEDIRFGNEGLCENIGSVGETYRHPMMRIPLRKLQMENYITDTQVELVA